MKNSKTELEKISPTITPLLKTPIAIGVSLSNMIFSLHAPILTNKLAKGVLSFSWHSGRWPHEPDKDCVLNSYFHKPDCL